MEIKMEVEDSYKLQAKAEVDMLFDKGFLNPELTRRSIDWLEDYLGFLFQSKCEMSAKCALLISSFKGDK